MGQDTALEVETVTVAGNATIAGTLTTANLASTGVQAVANITAASVAQFYGGVTSETTLVTGATITTATRIGKLTAAFSGDWHYHGARNA